MQLEQELLSSLIIHNKYASYLPDKKRRQTWDEIVNKVRDMHLDRFPDQAEQINWAFELVRDKKVLPSMRSAQFSGYPIERNESRIYNCSFLPVNSIESFSETMFLLLGGTGVGYSVQYQHVNKLPKIQKKTQKQKYLISDDIIGWAEAIRVLMRGYLQSDASTLPQFDYSDIRPKGELLKTAGGKAPGPEPLKKAIENITAILEEKKDGDQLNTLECHDIMCHIADAVLAGGIRRSAMVSLFSRGDEDMANCKIGDWYKDNLQRCRANNSAVINRNNITKEEFDQLYATTKASGSGEPGLWFTNDEDWGTNPCVEASLKPYQFCNLCDINGSSIKNQEDFEERCKAASIIGTLQASYTDFHYLRPIWKKTTEEDALLGVGITGIGSGRLKDINLASGAETVKKTNRKFAKEIGINPSARTTVVKPSGTSSCVLGSSSGVHAWHDNYFIRRFQLPKNDTLYEYLRYKIPELVQDYKAMQDTAVVEIPLSAPETGTTRDEPLLEFLTRVKRFNQEWVKSGHVYGANTHNVSATVNVKEDEWDRLGQWIWDNRNSFNGLSIIPFDGGNYEQAPFESIDKNTYMEMKQYLNEINLKEVREDADYTDLSGELACSGDSCEIQTL